MLKVLFLYNIDNWAIHNVGKLWKKAAETTKNLQIDLLNYHTIRNYQKLFSEYDYIWYGYIFMHKRMPWDLDKTIITIHDPMELFPEKPEWKSLPLRDDNLKILKKANSLVTISNEIHQILTNSGYKNNLINTMSEIPLRDPSTISTNKCEGISVLKDYPRKNLQLLQKIKSIVDQDLSIGSIRLKVGGEVLSESEYIDLLDMHEIYICTSYQEGGPLPAMDAMRRGAIILTTPVGQIQEIISDGFNGFICNSKEEFILRIRELSNDLNKLQQMRLNSLKSIKESRNINQISQSIKQLYNSIK